MSKHLLLAEDDQDFRDILKQYLQLFDYTVTCAQDGEEAFEVFQNTHFDICVLDVMMPKMDGFTLAEKMVEIRPETPFVFLTARKMKEDKIKGLKLGADDYIVKPFEADELILRLRNILKRNNRTVEVKQKSDCCKIGNYLFDSQRLELQYADEIQRLTKREAELIQFLFSRKNELLKREEVLQKIWKSADFFSGRSMDVFVSRLRKLFKKDTNITIESIRGVGLEFRVN